MPQTLSMAELSAAISGARLRCARSRRSGPSGAKRGKSSPREIHALSVEAWRVGYTSASVNGTCGEQPGGRISN